MKKLYAAVFIILLLCAAGTAVLLLLMPDTVPMHYNAVGEADRLGSKYENLLWPLLTLIMAAFFLLAARSARKKSAESSEKLLLIGAVCTLAFFTLLGFYFMAKTLRTAPEADPQAMLDDSLRFTGVGLGALLAALGNFMPKAKRNGLIGLRTKWSMANDRVWQKSQRFGGIVLMLTGLCMLLLSLFLPGMWNLLAWAVLIAAACVLSVLASRRYYREDKEAEDR